MSSQRSSKRSRHEHMPPLNFASMMHTDVPDGLGIVQTNGQTAAIDPTVSVHASLPDHISVPDEHNSYHGDTPISSLSASALLVPKSSTFMPNDNLLGFNFNNYNPGEAQVSIALGKAVKINLF